MTATPGAGSRLLEEHGRTWKVYVGEPDRFSATGLIHYPRLKDRFETHFVPFAQFEADAANGDLPDFSFIEPCLILGHGNVRPIRHYTERRVRAHVFLCMLAGYLLWHLRAALAPLTFTDEDPPARTNPVRPAARSRAADRKAARQRHDDNTPIHDFRSLLTHLGTLTRNELRFPHLPATPTIEQLTIPTPVQRRVFDLLAAPVPLRLT